MFFIVFLLRVMILINQEDLKKNKKQKLQYNNIMPIMLRGKKF